jgi:hypothetical protein
LKNLVRNRFGTFSRSKTTARKCDSDDFHWRRLNLQRFGTIQPKMILVGVNEPNAINEK